MDVSTIIWASVLGTLAALISMATTLVLCLVCWRRRQREFQKGHDVSIGSAASGARETDPLHVTSAQAQNVEEDGVLVLKRHNVEDRVKEKSALRFIPPLVTEVATKPLGVMSSKDGKVESSSSGPMSFFSSLLNSSDEQEEAYGQMMAQGDEDGGEDAGQIQFNLSYDVMTSTLLLRIIQAKDLTAKDILGTSDPYVKVCLLPDKKHKLETKVKHRTLHPRWNETFYFEGYPMSKLQKSTLHMHVFDYDRFSRDDPIGELYLPLSEINFPEKPTFWKTLRPTEKIKLGEILVSLMYVSRTSELSITIIKCRNLKAKDITGTSDPYVKIWHYRGEKRVEKKKTKILKSTLNPVYNETFQFLVPWEHIRETSMVVLVMDFDNIGRNDPIGKVTLAQKTGPTESKHWADMLNKPRQQVMQWHKLKPV